MFPLTELANAKINAEYIEIKNFTKYILSLYLITICLHIYLSFKVCTLMDFAFQNLVQNKYLLFLLVFCFSFEMYVNLDERLEPRFSWKYNSPDIKKSKRSH